jgi:hypothetical protein
MYTYSYKVACLLAKGASQTDRIANGLKWVHTHAARKLICA